jgi:hypothetical protein
MRGQKRLDFLLRQAEVFQHFAPTSAGTAAERKKKRGRHATGYTEEMEDEGTQSVCVCVWWWVVGHKAGGWSGPVGWRRQTAGQACCCS